MAVHADGDDEQEARILIEANQLLYLLHLCRGVHLDMRAQRGGEPPPPKINKKEKQETTEVRSH